MTRIASLSFVLASFAATLGGCATNGATTPGADELAAENQDGEQSKADAAFDNFNLLAVHQNGAFHCGVGTGGCINYKVDRPNRSTVACLDGSLHKTCGVGAVSFDHTGLSQTKINKITALLQAEAADPTIGTQVLVRGSFKSYVDFVGFDVTQVWTAQIKDGSSKGTFVRVSNTPVECIAAPCPTVLEGKLNSTKTAAIEGLDYGTRTDDALEARVAAALDGAQGAFVVGDRTTQQIPQGTEHYRSVNQVYLLVK